MKKALCTLVCVLLTVTMLAACTTTPPTAPAPAAPAAPAPAPAAPAAPAPEPAAPAAPAPAPAAPEPAAPAQEVAEPAGTLNYDLTGKKIGVAFYDLANPIWAATGENIVKIGNELGAEVTLVSCEGIASTQVSQMENMIRAGVDIIVVGPQDANALGDVVKQANAAGVLVMAYGQAMENVDAQYVVQNYDAGTIVGQKAGEWIRDNLGGKAKVGMLDYPLMQDIIDRANGIIDGMKSIAPDAEIVMTATSADPVTGMEAVETFLQAHPDIKVITCIGDGGAVGANNAVKAAGKATDDFGIFSCDGTEEALSAMLAGDPIRMSVGLGTPTQKATQVVDLAARMMLGQPFDFSEYTPMDPVDISIAQQYFDDAGFGQ